MSKIYAGDVLPMPILFACWNICDVSIVFVPLHRVMYPLMPVPLALTALILSMPFCRHAFVDNRFTVSVRVLMMAASESSPFCLHALVESSKVSRFAAMRDHLLPVLSQ
jgi:hypothetical protein